MNTDKSRLGSMAQLQPTDVARDTTAEPKKLFTKRHNSREQSDERRSKTFMDLPRELRDEVYGYLLASPKTINLARDVESGPLGQLTLPSEIRAIGRISSDLREEAVETYLSGNGFSLTLRENCDELLPKELSLWPKAMGAGDHLHHIRHIELELRYQFICPVVDYLWDFVEVKYVYTIQLAEKPYVMCKHVRGHFKEVCVCELERELANLMGGAGGNDGEVLLDVVTQLLGDAGNLMREEQRGACAEVKLVLD